MKFTILTLFPKVFDQYINSSIIKKALNSNTVEIEIINFRDFSKNKHNKVDDTPYGGGPGMVLMLQPIVDALKQVKTKGCLTILLTPSGYQFNNKMSKVISKCKHIILICGHYEGFDERINKYVDVQLSIGDYVLTGGELPALVVLDATIRQIENVINKESLINESFENNLLDYPVYTKPYEFDGMVVPEVLIGGNHKLINEYRVNQQIEKTKKFRKDLYQKYLKEKKG
ncbi:tRNA (guanosine(37)-N1)-methyltransferase TrmD [Malacoplasma iowae]|uniref:tRNA (guanine-N(1)-)-methyltransferase n=3 Tax=Malacoplasma iowae TaxID=2116 RepID=A0A084U471_MALIO|nr:tRNA (guanosine(37)-N1)-methyltransferase TrmD [Malacoplasma iowae]VEU63181.1 tRNA (guanine-N(1)-)-methyltransferase [Mycoplasmopsis fermentans]KFB07757.1 tRNA (guanine-N(1)-)-methyltransferase [Malacoplasma iowae DK-CPA]QHG89566.1 tRNA (guanosine(37)-N1)-methyltransferase TrmD [Malacoplasma iowae 695]WPL35655.1 tRNA (guanosine(37)-N1)-methyltransferase TrmD [Malacoplasma iowae]WPL36812.1 tRNA (guanosine(37)-N1)-methyltransferase TrmD [Malacoplasma iowae]